MGNPQAEQFVAEIIRFINKVLNDPSVITRNPSEFKSAIAIAARLSQIMPSAAQFAAVTFERFIRDLVANPTLREAVKAQFQAPPPPTPPSSGSQTDMMSFQREMANYTMMMETLSNVMQNMSDVQKSVIRNIR